MRASWILLFFIVIISSIVRLLPHPANVTPIIALAITGGILFKNSRESIIAILLSMFISDLFLGFHELTLVVYASLIFITFISPRFINLESSYKKVGLTAFSGSLFFFVVTNFFVWAIQNMYPKNIAGLIECYVAAIPFWGNSLVGDLFYTMILFYLVRSTRATIEKSLAAA